MEDAQAVASKLESAAPSAPKRNSGRGADPQEPNAADTLGVPAAPVAVAPADPLPFCFNLSLVATTAGNTSAAGLRPALTGDQPEPEAVPLPPPDASATQNLLAEDLAFAVKATPKPDPTPSPAAEAPIPAAPANSLPAPQIPVPQPASQKPPDQPADAGRPKPPADRGTPGDARLVANDTPVHVAPVKEKESSPDAGPQPEKPFMPWMDQPPAHASTPPPEAHGEPVRPVSVADLTPVAEPPVKPVEPLKQLSLQVGGAGQQRVELRVVERSGELQVAVRAASSELSQGLRQGLSDLVSRLDQNGFHAETWRPGAPVGAVQATVETRQESAQFQNNGSQQQHSGSQQQNRQQGQQQQSPRPQWVEELEGSLAGRGIPSSGESYGISR